MTHRSALQILRLHVRQYGASPAVPSPRHPHAAKVSPICGLKVGAYPWSRQFRGEFHIRCCNRGGRVQKFVWTISFRIHRRMPVLRHMSWSIAVMFASCCAALQTSQLLLGFRHDANNAGCMDIEDGAKERREHGIGVQRLQTPLTFQLSAFIHHSLIRVQVPNYKVSNQNLITIPNIET